MNCPYCAEEVKDQALVCHFCTKDLAIYRPFLVRVAELQTQVSDLKAELEMATHRIQESAIFGATVFVPTTIAVFISFGLSLLFYGLTWQQVSGDNFDKLLEFLSTASPFVAALWLGFSGSRLVLPSRITIGLLCGLLGFVQRFFLFHGYVFWFDRIYFLIHKQKSFADYVPMGNSGQQFWLYLLAGSCLFPIGFLSGERFRKGRVTGKSAPISASLGQAGSLQSVLSALSPIIVAVIGVISAVLTTTLKSR